MTLQSKRLSTKDFLINNALIIILVALAIAAGIYNVRFFSGQNIRNMSINASVRFIIALGVSGCLITRGTDLSAGRMVGLGACIAGTLLQTTTYSQKFYPELGDMNILLVLAITILICGAIGLINGFVIAFFKVPPFITTLGIQMVVYGICLVYTGSIPLGGYRREYTSITTSTILNIGSFKGIPIVAIVAAAVGGLMWVLYNKTRHGKFMYAIGGNENAAEVSGVKVKRTLVIIYGLAACLYAFGGFLLGAKGGGANVNTGFGYELEAIASCTIGGVSTSGGIGRISSVLIGVLVFEMLKSAMQFLQIDTNYQYIVQGFVIIIAVALDLRKYLAKK